MGMIVTGMRRRGTMMITTVRINVRITVISMKMKI